MGKLKDIGGQQHFEFDRSDTQAQALAKTTLTQLETLNGASLVAALVQNGIFRDAEEAHREYSMGIDRGSGDFGGQLSFADFLRQGKDDWRTMLSMIAEGDAANGEAARLALYEGRDNITILRQRQAARETRDRTRNVLDNPKPR